jgi:sodium-dependent phosphate cotransporter
LAQISRDTQQDTTAKTVVRILLVLVWLYLFLLAVTLMGSAFKLFGSGFKDALFEYTSNPIAGLFIGILATSIVQSSSTVTSTVVAMVASGTLKPVVAVPIIMGCNIGTSVTSIIVAMGFVHRRQEFGRAIAGSTVHDFFNVLVTIILFPVECFFHPLQRAAEGLAGVFSGLGEGTGELSFTSPVKAVVGPPAHAIVEFLTSILGFGNGLAGVVALVIAGALLFFALVRLTKTMRKLMIGRLSVVFNKTLKRGGVVAILVGMVATAVVQSSSVVTSLFVPLVAAGLIDVAQVFPLTLGANIGTTVTALLASLAGDFNGLVIAFTHVLFNVFGVLIVYPTPLRKIPIALARKMGTVAQRNRKFAIIYLIVAFFVVPIAVILVSRLLD